jgi:ATP-binding cassette subfamily C protein LapB
MENLTGFDAKENAIMRAREAARLMALDQVVSGLPHGYETILTDSHSDPVSHGVKQRIALVRALLHYPGILLFDDAEGMLDKEDYNKLFQLMGKLKGHCTLVMVSHDQNLLSFADRFFELQDGHLVPVAHGKAPALALLAQPFSGSFRD